MSTKQVMIFVDESEQDKRSKAKNSVSRVLPTYPGSITAEVDEAQAEQLKREGFHLEPLTCGATIKLQSIELDPKIEVPVSPQTLKHSLIEAISTE